MKYFSNTYTNLEEAANSEVVGSEVRNDEILLVFVPSLGGRGDDLHQAAVDPEHDGEGSLLIEQLSSHGHPAAEDPEPCGNHGLLLLLWLGLYLAVMTISSVCLHSHSGPKTPGL